MRKCQFCAEEIQDAAVVCKHCKRDLVTAAPAVVVPVRKTGNTRLLLILLAIIIGMIVLSTVTRPDEPELKTLGVTVSWNATALRVTNAANAGAAGHEMIVYINGQPPFTYRANSTVPAVGQTVQLPLIGFVTDDGDRFNPLAKAVTVAWVGGGGYDYASFKH